MTYQIRIDSHKPTGRRKPHTKIVLVRCNYLAHAQTIARYEQAEVEGSGRVVDRVKIEVK